MNPLDDPLELYEPPPDPCGTELPGDCGLDPLSAVYLAGEEEARRAGETAERPQAATGPAF